MKKVWILLLTLPVVAGGTYFFGPRTSFPALQFQTRSFNVPLNEADVFIAAQEEKIADLKPGNEARILWADSVGKKTEFVLLYLHGFSASHEEGSPLHQDFGKRFGCNVYLSRLYDHGRLDSNTFRGMTPQLYYDSAEEAYARARALGEKVIIMSCSTGGTLDILLSQNHPEIAAHIMYSPNIAIADANASLITGPWGEYMLEWVWGSKYHHIQYTEEAKKYWNETYHADGVIALQYMLDNYMNETHFKRIDQPLFLGCYFRDEAHQDNVVSVEAMRSFFKAISTPEAQKRFVEFPAAGRHVISSHIFSADIEGVRKATYAFAEEVLGMQAVVTDSLSLR